MVLGSNTFSLFKEIPPCVTSLLASLLELAISVKTSKSKIFLFSISLISIVIDGMLAEIPPLLNISSLVFLALLAASTPYKFNNFIS